MKRNVIENKIQKRCMEYTMLEMMIKANDKKQVDRRLRAIKLHIDGKSDKEIAEKLDYSRQRVSQ
jgi:DNA-binding NarL/FixJ family response regulator